MRTLTWRTLLRSALLATGVSLGLGAIGEQPLLRTTAAADDMAQSAATVDEVAAVLDLRTLTLPEGATLVTERALHALNYEIRRDPKSAFTQIQQQLTTSGWKESPQTKIDELSCFGRFQKSGFVLSVNSDVSREPDKKGMRWGFNHVSKALTFETSDDFDAVATYYQQRLAKSGWKPTAEKLTP